MEIRQRDTGAILTDSQFRSLFSSISLPKELTAEVLEPYGYDPVLNGPQAEVTGPYEYSVRDGVEWSNGNWFTKFTVGPTFKTYTDEDGVTVTAAEQEAAYRQRIDEEAAKRVRDDRNKRLAETDWRVTYEVEKASIDGLGIQFPMVWADYRQALRDITSQPGFPHNVTWPEEPTT